MLKSQNILFLLVIFKMQMTYNLLRYKKLKRTCNLKNKNRQTNEIIPVICSTDILKYKNEHNYCHFTLNYSVHTTLDSTRVNQNYFFSNVTKFPSEAVVKKSLTILKDSSWTYTSFV